MKSLKSKLTRFNPFRALRAIRELRAEALRLRAENESMHKHNHDMWERYRFIENNVPDDGAARAMLMQLRVHGMTDRAGRTGFGVTAFIPEETLSAIREKDVAVTFTRIVADELVRRALAGAHHVNSRGAVSALLFEPLVPGRPCGVIGNVFDTPRGPAIALGRAPGDDYETHQRKEKLAMQKMLERNPPLLPREAESDL